MNKYKVLGYINIFLSAIFLILFGFFLIHILKSERNVLNFIKQLFSEIILFIPFISFVTNAYVAYRLLVKKEHKQPFISHVLMTLLPILWIFIYIIGSFFASQIFYHILILVFFISLFYLLKKFPKQHTIVILLITVVVVITSFITGFEEDYCWDKGAKLDPTGSKMAIATKEDAEGLKGFEVLEGATIGVSFREHMLCHDDFNFFSALKDIYFK